jgi:hypothetical protein
MTLDKRLPAIGARLPAFLFKAERTVFGFGETKQG